MSVFLTRGGAAAAIIVVSTQAAFADLSAQEVWEDWKAYFAGTGYDVTGTESNAGGALTVSDVVMSLPISEDDESATITLPEIKFMENGDGTVNVLLPAEFPLNFELMVDGDGAKGTLNYAHDGTPITVAGDTDSMRYDYHSDKVSLTLDSLIIDGEALPAETVMAQFVLNNVVNKTTMTTGETRQSDQSMTADSLTYNFGFNAPEGEDKASFQGTIEGLSFTGDSTIPSNVDFDDVQALFESGFAFDGAFTFTGGNSNVSVVDGSDAFDAQSSSEGGKIGVAMDSQQLSYDVTQIGSNIAVSGSDIPFPLALSMAETGFKLMVPIAKSTEEQDFAMGITLRDFAVPEMLWGMVDPTGQLPHDPATIVVDLAGKAKVLLDLFDEEAIKSLEKGQAQPGELNALTVKQLLVSAAGAELTGTGDFTFNNDDLTSFDGMPAPSGAADLKLTGANTLIDKLIEMGLMSDGDAMGARMMMGMLAVPGEGEDTLTSKIEISEDGQIRANGQRIK